MVHDVPGSVLAKCVRDCFVKRAGYKRLARLTRCRDSSESTEIVSMALHPRASRPFEDCGGQDQSRICKRRDVEAATGSPASSRKTLSIGIR